jgi:hypothetical protein
MSNNNINLEFLLKVLSLTANISYMDIWWRTDGDYAPVSIFINCHNVFSEGFADFESITPDNIHILEKASEDIKAIGASDEFIPMLFCARIRKQRPRDEMIPDNNKVMKLFHECGPYILYPDLFVPKCAETNEDIADDPDTSGSWWQRLLEFISNILKRISQTIGNATETVTGFVKEKIEGLV